MQSGSPVRACQTAPSTLVELLVVIAVRFGVLTLLLTPGLARTQPDSRTARCLSNKRQIQMACAMYAADNNDIISDLLLGLSLGGVTAVWR